MTPNLKTYREELNRQKESEIEAAIKSVTAALNKKYERKFAALEVLLEDDGEVMEVDLEESVLAGGPKTFSEAVRMAIRDAKDGFSSKTLFQAINTKYPDLAKDKSPADISAPLWVLRQTKQIAPMEEGSGRRATTYRKTDQFKA